MRNKKLNGLLELIETLSEDEQKEVVDEIMNKLQASTQRIKTCNDMLLSNTNKRPDCPHCGALSVEGHVIKRGKKKDVQRYYCKKCRKIFVATTNTVFSYTHKKADVWRKFIFLTITGASLIKCSQECHIAYQTAFTWRHKILNALLVDQDNIFMDGVVEMDEMLVSISYKGNHVQGHFNEKRRLYEGRENEMPRPSFKRGTDNKSSSSNDKVCVCCLVENGNKTFYASTPGVGFMKNNMLQTVVDKHVKKETAILLVDEYKVTKKYLENNLFRFKSLASNTSDNYKDHKPEIDGLFHLQHVNAMHHHIRRFLAKYCGVSSKYLCNYVSLYVWLRTMKSKKEEDLNKAYLATASTLKSYISYKDLHAYPPVPMCA